jgi:hypothetical protein
MIAGLGWEEATDEDARTQVRRRLQQRRCLVCGSRGLVNRQTSYFCAAHVATHRFCSTCETLCPTHAHGADSRCRACSTARSLSYYHANAERNIYRIRLRAIAQRRESRGEQILRRMRDRIALASLVAATPGWSWRQRGQLLGRNAAQLATAYRRQCAGDVSDADGPDRATRKRA